MSGACAALLASMALGASGLRYDLGATAQASYTTDWARLAPFRTTQLELVPRIGLSYGERGFSLRLTYHPQILADGSWSVSVLHRAILSFELRASRAFKVGALANASYGTIDFRYQAASLPPASSPTPDTTPPSTGGTEPPSPPGAPSPPPTAPAQTVQSVPLAARATYLEASAGLGLEVRGARDLGVKALLSYMVRAGADTASSLAVPYQRGPTVGVEIDWRLARRHTLATILAGSYYDFPPEPPAPSGHAAWTSQLVESWKHELGHADALQLGLGVGAAGNATESRDLVVRDVTPVAEAALHLGGLRLAAGYRPSVDYTSGLSARRVDVFASLAIPLSGRWSLLANGAAAEVVSGLQRGQVTASAQLLASARLARALRAFAGLTGLWQRAGPDYPAADIRQVGLLVGFDYFQGGRF